MEVELENSFRKLCVIGDPVGHSLSPLLHNTLCQTLALPYIYLCQPVTRETLGDFLQGAKALGYAGFNATMPFKELLIPYLDGIDPAVERLGAVNTVCIKNGKLYGYNTDMPGFVAALRHSGFEPMGRRALILGAGGAAAAVAVGLREAGAKVVVANRTAEKARRVAALADGAAVGFDIDTLAGEASQAELLVNATSLGMAGQPSFPDLAFLEDLSQGSWAVDLIYHPARTAFLERAEVLGHPIMNGLPLLLHQAVLALEHFTGTSIPLETAIPLLEQTVTNVIGP